MVEYVGKIMTVLGLIEPSALGTTISHEHLVFDLSCYLRPSDDPEEAKLIDKQVTMENLHFVSNNPYGNRDNCIVKDIDLPLREIELFKKYGGNSIVDLTLDDFGRDVKALHSISKQAGINIVAGCGHYIQSAHPASVANKTAEQLANEFINEIKNGVGDTGICPGVIGEIGTGFKLHSEEVKVLRAAAMAQVETGLPISVHLHPPVRYGHDVLDILIAEGVDPRRVVLAHLDGCLTHPDISFHDALDYLSSLAARGCYTEFDLCGNSGYFITDEASWWLPSDRERAKAIANLCLRGFSGHILLSHDVGHRHYLAEYGGWGYSHVLNGFQRTLREAGIPQETIKKFTKDNPARMLTIG